ncbi:MAG: 4Fe-4S ferredoxin [Deltaproteobacteria bacterium]|nr:4Fe-4S ferredoxin [Deltaproteobacteria bacterium]MBW1921906.1 4Fe-4S ferredoxin [Deltaproteobacteria bacterium]MBW1951237.1 4Fe-4S ferredoxin [Deltaproteobacteria bacterium]MBW2009653.1 4Fe-4S ferredoxin [Deltaproteobacteria bacterium]MBW2349324.1 4Fe-4S ferredoxin [Deltaproteobacteria bacterium]
MKVMRKIIEIDDELCDGCGECVPSCAEGAIEIVDGKARLVAEKYCDGLGACLGECPNGALRVVEREAEDFDEEAVEEYLKKKNRGPEPFAMAPACPSSQVHVFEPSGLDKGVGGKETEGRSSNRLTHWPVQINLIPPTAPFLKGADLLVAADCVAAAYANFHADFLEGRVVMIGCPKFDDVAAYIEKFTEIFKTAGIRSITVLVMEVPCCSGLPVILQRAMDAAGKKIPMDQVVIGTRGEILQKGAFQALRAS